jgi:hypothetical protein
VSVALYSLAQVHAAVRDELRILAEEIEAGWATRDTNDGSTYCSQCGAPQPKRGKWKHDPCCEVEIIRQRSAVYAYRRSAKATETKEK